MKSSNLDGLFRLFLILVSFFLIFSAYIIVVTFNRIINSIENYHKENKNERYSIEEKV